MTSLTAAFSQQTREAGTLAERHIDFRELKRWLINKGYHDALPILGTALPSLGSRVGLLERDLDAARGHLEKFRLEQTRAIRDPERAARIGEDPELHRIAKDLYYAVLDCLSRLHGLVEVLLLYYGTLRRGVRNLPKMLTDRRPIDTSDEIKRIQGLKLRELKQDFNYPDVSNYNCPTDDKVLLRAVLSRTAKELREYLQNLGVFRQRFLMVHNKYKHTLAEDVSKFLVVRRNGEVECVPQFYIRSKERSPRSQQPRVYTYAIRTDDALLDYLDSLIDQFATVMVSLVDSYIQWLANMGAPAFPRQFRFDPEEEDHLRAILDAEPSFLHVKDFLPEFRVSWSQKANERVERGMRHHHIAKLSMDILDPRKLKRFEIGKKDEGAE